ncbi:hypothetical protein BT67DRAFT_155427 [Trichocladium antarcticum]|uniref:Uncharacterized protein n=1 Tax=Trichocladium antarcticum TaxID=1450529 RepID=A0AAN6UF16_9PEZI|nr:hypothetical protein BT67DRAFT_155427 [Trichocladium antarcticum]
MNLSLLDGDLVPAPCHAGRMHCHETQCPGAPQDLGRPGSTSQATHVERSPRLGSPTTPHTWPGPGSCSCSSWLSVPHCSRQWPCHCQLAGRPCRWWQNALWPCLSSVALKAHCQHISTRPSNEHINDSSITPIPPDLGARASLFEMPQGQLAHTSA